MKPPARRVQLPMRSALWILAAGALVVAGCGQKDTPLNIPASQANNKPAEQPKDPYAVPGLPKGANKQVFHKPNTFAIPTKGGDGWKAPAEVPSDLGAKVDNAMRTVKESLVAVTMNYDDAGNRLTGAAVIKIRDKSKFNIEYYRPETMTALNRFVADGKQRIKIAEGKRNPLPGFGDAKAKAFSAAEIDTWAQNFTERMFNPLTTDEATWDGLLAAWKKGVGGYTMQIESKKASPGGQVKPYFRVLAETKEGKPTTVEVVIDANRFLPVAVKVVRKNKDGTERKQYWSGNWQFGGRHEDKSFVVPPAS